jgi:oxygen-independent coproporphyrinogen-3 oxidase
MTLTVPPDLVAKYRTRAPRYTSYPTAPQFHPIAPAEVDAALARSRDPLSLYVHIPFCTHLCLYCGCHVEIREKRTVGDGYVDTLLREADLVRSRLAPGNRGSLGQMALGGGTPTFLLPEQMQRLIAGIRDRFPFRPDGDYSIEVDPRSVTPEYVRLLVELGFNRFSFGVQDFDVEVLKAVNRPQPRDLTERCVSTLRELGDFNLNFDLMYGLPHQTPESWRPTLDAVVALRPTRIALFLYAHVPWMKPAQKLVEKRGLPEADVKSRLFLLANEVLGAAGYQPIGMDHFALPGDELLAAQASRTLQRNFMGYTTRAGLDQLNLGVSAIGNFGGVYAQDLKDRTAWTERIEAGELPTDRGFVLSPDDQARRAVIMELFCNFRTALPKGAFAAERERLRPLEADGLLRQDDAGIEVTPLGRHFIRNICSVFDAYFEADAEARRYSHTA